MNTMRKYIGRDNISLPIYESFFDIKVYYRLDKGLNLLESSSKPPVDWWNRNITDVKEERIFILCIRAETPDNLSRYNLGGNWFRTYYTTKTFNRYHKT